MRARHFALWICFALGACSDAGPSEREPVFLPGEAPAAEAEGSAPAELEVPAGSPVVVFLGDSIAAGLHLSMDQAFPAAAQRLLAERGRPFELVNAGVSGDTSAGGLRRVDWVLRSAPDVVVVELGYNDGLRGQPPEAVEANLRGIVEACQAVGARVLLLGARLPPSLGPEYVREFDALYPRLAEELDLEFVPYFLDGVGGIPELNLGDGMHPNPAGHRRIAERIAPALERALVR